MFNKKLSLSREYLEWYQNSRYRARIDFLSGKLFDLGYLYEVIIKHVHEWIRFTNYCDEICSDIPTSIHAQEIANYLEWRFPKGSKGGHSFIKISLRIFIEADEHGNFSKRIRPPPKPTSVLFKEWVPPYLRFLQVNRGVSQSCLRNNTLVLREFTEFLENRRVHDFKDLTAAEIHDFCMKRGNRKPVTWTAVLGMVRRFLKYLFLQHGLEKDLSFAVGSVKGYRHSGICDVLTEPEVDKILGSFDRSSATGRRDYAIVLLAARYGMRPSDIRQLRLEDIKWRLGQIVFCQSKTGRQLTLPLLSDVSDALIDYIRFARPSTEFRNIFVRHRVPIQPFVPSNNLSMIMTRALHKAELDKRTGARGIYLFRYTLATKMLSTNTSIKTIGDILGHVSTDSTFGYAKVDLINLRAASLSISEVLNE